MKSKENITKSCIDVPGTYKIEQFAFKLKMKDDLLDLREIPTRRRVGIVFSLVKSNHNKFPKNPYYRYMLAWNSLPVDISLLDSKESFTKAVKDTVHNPYIKVL